MIDFAGINECFRELRLESWTVELEQLLRERMSDGAHGDFDRWRVALENLPTIVKTRGRIDNDVIAVGSGVLSDPALAAIRAALLELSPWRKGPFNVCGVAIDAEWRSDLKWNRLKDAVASLDGRKILDVGSGNGYYALRMRGAGAASVLGIDPTLSYVMQFLAVRHFMLDEPVCILPLRLHELPGNSRVFDTTFSMGVLYHQRSPLDHLRQLRGTLRDGGQLVLETLYVPGKESYACTPAERYARMRNVWLLPTIAELTTWLRRSGFDHIDIVDESVTTTDEQRSTDWMRFESLREALDPDDPTRTVEGWPAPQRVIALATAA